jgi:hypothetical protein
MGRLWESLALSIFGVFGEASCLFSDAESGGKELELGIRVFCSNTVTLAL